jgi:hypothetical protein
VAKQFSAPVDSFQAVLAQTSFKEFNKTVLPECLVNKRLFFNSKSHEGPLLKEEVLIWPTAGAAGVAIGMLGSAIGKGDGDAATLTKKKRRKAF